MWIPTLLLNAFIIILCIFCYQIFWLDKDGNKVRNNVLISFLSSISTVLCISFPFSFHLGYIYDLRLIPILLAFLIWRFKKLYFCYLCISFLPFLLRRKRLFPISYYYGYFVRFYYCNILFCCTG